MLPEQVAGARPLVFSIPLARITSQVGGVSAFYVKQPSAFNL
jgi:hypothetical protein